MKHALVVIDMQNDFIDGVFANPEAQKIVPKVADLIRRWDGPIYLTLDTHEACDWRIPSHRKALRIEAKKLPPHCIKYTQGWLPAPEIQEALEGKSYSIMEKNTFAANLQYLISDEETSITLVGLCTDICVVSNALNLVYEFPYNTVRVISDLCAGTTTKNHEAALRVMASCLVEVTDSHELPEILEKEAEKKE